MEETGKRIQRARERKVYSRAELATMAGMTYTALYRIEEGQRMPRMATIRAIAAALDLDPYTLVADTPQEMSAPAPPTA